MKRTQLSRKTPLTRSALKRSGPKARTSSLGPRERPVAASKASKRPKRPPRAPQAPQSPRELWALLPGARCVVPGCGAWAVHLHHVCYQQEVRRRGGDLYDPANGMAACLRCHERHHTAAGRIALTALPPAALDFAYRLMGAFAADYLARRYAGHDPRLDALRESSTPDVPAEPEGAPPL